MSSYSCVATVKCNECMRGECMYEGCYANVNDDDDDEEDG